MATDYGNKSIVTDGLVFLADAANKQSYIGSGTTVNDLVGNVTATVNNATVNNEIIDFDGSDDVPADILALCHIETVNVLANVVVEKLK